MKQSRRMSLVEALANVAVGYGVAVATQIAVFPMFGLQTSVSEGLSFAAGAGETQGARATPASVEEPADQPAPQQ